LTGQSPLSISTSPLSIAPFDRREFEPSGKAERPNLPVLPHMNPVMHNCTTLLHTDAMGTANKAVRQSIEAEKRKQQEFFKLAEKFRNTADPKEAKRLGDKLGRMVFGG